MYYGKRTTKIKNEIIDPKQNIKNNLLLNSLYHNGLKIIKYN